MATQGKSILFGRILDIAVKITEETNADCFVSYHAHVNGIDVQMFEFGWTRHSKGETLCECWSEFQNSDAQLLKLWQDLTIFYNKHKKTKRGAEL